MSVILFALSRDRATNLEFFLSRETPVVNVALETTDGVLCAAHALNLVTSTVSGTWVRHSIAIFISSCFK